MTAGVLSSDTVPVNWTIERADDSGLRKSLYVQMQGAYDAIDQLGYQQAASLLTAQLTTEMNLASTAFNGTAWTAPLKAGGSDIDYEKAYGLTRSLLMSGVSSSGLGDTDVRRFFHGGNDAAVYAPVREYFSYAADPYGFMDDSYKGHFVETYRDGVFSGNFYMDQSGSLHNVAPWSDAEVENMIAITGATVPDNALPGDVLKSGNGKYYLVGVTREAVELPAYFPVLTSATTAQSDAFSEQLARAIGELTKNGQIEAARMQQLVNLLQTLLGGASNTEAKESRARESILSKIG